MIRRAYAAYVRRACAAHHVAAGAGTWCAGPVRQPDRTLTGAQAFLEAA